MVWVAAAMARILADNHRLALSEKVGQSENIIDIVGVLERNRRSVDIGPVF
jgi:hypothetical protein